MIEFPCKGLRQVIGVLLTFPNDDRLPAGLPKQAAIPNIALPIGRKFRSPVFLPRFRT